MPPFSHGIDFRSQVDRVRKRLDGMTVDEAAKLDVSPLAEGEVDGVRYELFGNDGFLSRWPPAPWTRAAELLDELS